jgi:V/A-type H+-transporting ATPase subunit C
VGVLRDFRDPVDYGYLVGRVRVWENHLLKREHFERLIGAKTFQEVKRVLSETPYDFLSDFDKLAKEKLKEAVEAHLASHFADLEKTPAPNSFFKMIHLPFDTTNLKILLRTKLFGAPHVPLSQLGFLSQEEMERVVNGALRIAPFANWVREAAEQGVKADIFDHFLDRKFFEEMLRLAFSSRSSFLVNFVQKEIDLANLRVLFRSRERGLSLGESFIEGGRVGILTLQNLASFESEAWQKEVEVTFNLISLDVDFFEASLEKELKRFLERARYISLGPEPIFSYFWRKKSEALAVERILLGQLGGWPHETLRKELQAYV